MPQWGYVLLFVGLLLAFGGWIDWRRRASVRGAEHRQTPPGGGGLGPGTHDTSGGGGGTF